MNKYEEAFDELKEVLYLPDKYLEKRLNILQELVEKATPKKLNNFTIWNSVWEIVLGGRCVCCNKILSSDREEKYCSRCGQAIDWSEDTKIL